jgi:hypothetical protein
VKSLLVLALVACGSSPPPPPKPVEPVVEQPKGPSDEELAAQHARQEQQKHDEIVAAHREIESEQQDALALTCAKGDPPAQPRCLPSCYATEAHDKREGQRIAGAAEMQHVVCEQKLDGGEFGPPAIVDELDLKLKTRAFARRFPAAHKKGWQADVETALREHLAKGDAIYVTGAWRDTTNPLTHEPLRCAAAAQYTHALHGKLDACGGSGKLACEAGGNAAARAINVVHYRLAEAKGLQAKHDDEKCRQAALEAIAVSRGLPRYRQYKKLNVHQWTDNLVYKTRFDGTLDEDTLFATATTLGTEAESVYAACGGEVNAKTKPADEQSFHACW